MAQVASDIGAGALGPGRGAPPAAVEGKTPRQLFWGRFKRDKLALFGAAFIVLLVTLALVAPIIANNIVHHGPNERFQSEMTDEFGLPAGPNRDFWFGADLAGRDLFVRVIYGTRTSLIVALVATAFSTVVGVSLGVASGYFGGALDAVVSRAIDIVLSMPYLLFALGITAACSTSVEGCLGGLIRPGLPLVIFVVALFTWPMMARIVRGNTLSIRENEFIEASRSLGAGHGRIMFGEVLPNLVAPIIVFSTLKIPELILFESALSFLGVGVPQSIPSWGRMLADASRVFEVAWWMMFFPGLFLFLTTLAFNLLGDGLRDALDPRSGR